jgi:hypothetical protein
VINEKNIVYKNLEVPESSKDVISKASYKVKPKILIFTLSEKFENAELLHFVDTSRIEKTIKDLSKKVKFKFPAISEKDLYKVEDVILRNASILEDNSNRDGITEIQQQMAEPRPEISFEEWEKILQQKYEILRETTFKNFSDVWQAIEFTLSVKNVLHIKGNTLPFAGTILGQPSSSKTLALEMLRKISMTFYTDSFTAKSFVSHNTAVSKDQLVKIDMLPKIKNKLFLTPELAPLFSARDEDLLNVLGIVTRILDGHGYESDTGAYGHRGYNENIMFTWVGAAVEIPYKVYKHLGTLGPKLYFFRMSSRKKNESELLNDLRFGNFNLNKTKVEEALIDYLNWFDFCPIGSIESNILKIPAEHERHEEEALRCIIKLGKTLSHLRGAVITWETKGTQGSDYSYAPPIIENPDRAITCLRNLAIGHAFISGRSHITMEDIPILIKVVLSTAPVDRFKVFDLLLERQGELNTRTLLRDLDFSRPTALRTMTELKVLGLVNMKKEDEEIPNSILSIKLKEEFDWFLSEEFKKLRGGFIPEKFETECKEKNIPPTLKKYDDGENFDYDYVKQITLKEFIQIETNEVTYERGRLVVEHDNLREAILRNPDAIKMKLTEEAAENSIDNLLREGIFIESSEGWYYRTSKDDNAAAATAAA